MGCERSIVDPFGALALASITSKFVIPDETHLIFFNHKEDIRGGGPDEYH
jgi:hypothetical protein